MTQLEVFPSLFLLGNGWFIFKSVRELKTSFKFWCFHGNQRNAWQSISSLLLMRFTCSGFVKREEFLFSFRLTHLVFVSSRFKHIHTTWERSFLSPCDTRLLIWVNGIKQSTPLSVIFLSSTNRNSIRTYSTPCCYKLREYVGPTQLQSVMFYALCLLWFYCYVLCPLFTCV